MSAWIFTSDIPLYLPNFFDQVLEEQSHVVDRIVLVKLPLERLMRQQYRLFGPVDGIRMARLYVRGMLLSMLSPSRQRRLTGSLHSVRDAASVHDIPVTSVPDVNDPDFVRRVESADPELVFSIICGQRLGADLLAVPDWPINLHPSLLPDYRGPASVFWALYHGEDETGWTAHVMNEEFDDGPIVDRWPIGIGADDTFHTLTQRLTREGVDIAIEVLQQFPNATFETKPNPTNDEDYYPLPTADERREFKRRGNQLL